MNDDIREISTRDVPQLLEIPEPPKRLFVRGALPGSKTALLTVVGSRKYTHYGKDICCELIGGLAGYDIAIVSGLALGIDSIAHKAALGAGIKTIAVPGSGLSDNVLYPATNRLLARKIVEGGGALVSEFDPSFHATTWSFPQRNRIMAGLAQATLVIEAGDRSGTLITARLALDYNRDVLAVPGSVFSSNSRGTNRLLRQGATPITSSAELLYALGFEAEENKNARRDIDIANCSREEQQALQLLSEPLTRDELIRALHIPTTRANILITSMEIKGLLHEQGGVMRLA